jgi:sialic acid synthase SpsE
MKLFKTKRNAIYIAEIGLNHNGDYDTALSMIEAAKKAGADAVKFQTFIPELLISPYADSLVKNGTDEVKDFKTIDFFKNLILNKKELSRLKKKSEEMNIVFFSSPFDTPSLELLEELDVPLYKIASSEITNIRLIKAVALTGKPAIFSTGISNEHEIEKAVEIFKLSSNAEIALLHCVSLYPLQPQYANLKRIKTLKDKFGLLTGFSDHSIGYEASMIASVFGARIFEKHFTLDRNFKCPDKEVSLDPAGFSTMIDMIENAILMEGTGALSYSRDESSVARSARRSLFAAKNIPACKIIEESDLTALRPGVGIGADSIDSIIGRKTLIKIEKEKIIKEDHLE